MQSNYIKTFINGNFKEYIEDAINNQLFPLIQEKTELLPVLQLMMHIWKRLKMQAVKLLSFQNLVKSQLRKES